MTSASKSRVQRRAAEKVLASKLSYKPGDAAKSVITLTEIPGTGGFTVGLGLHGARMEELYPNTTHPVSIVDVMALAVSAIIRQRPQALQDAVGLVAQTLGNVHKQLAEGASVEDAIASADKALDGAIGDVDGVANDQTEGEA